MEGRFAGFDPLAIIRRVHDVVRGVEKLLNRLTKKVCIAVGHIEFDGDRAADLHINHNMTYG